MMKRGVMLGEVTGIVITATAPVDYELAVGNAIFNPVETHVALFDGVLVGTGIALSVWTGVAVCGCPILLDNVVCILFHCKRDHQV
jgi:hypothetical protein